ncbi:rod shape-determining protein MreC [Xylophilus ampelinus]|uniref:Cell shape-determining protein MreC n=1 Tax=Xylophilus ampelinus TaxID=54067 RepID=A0A318SJZ9_9BURK|nr:rod shape-determining protein MreC [Xylophilus ampelinus]
MPLGTLDRTAPPFFKQGPSALSTLVFFAALALFLMVADARLGITPPLRMAISTVLYPLERIALQPVAWVRGGLGYLQTVQSAQQMEDTARQQMLQQSQRANQVEELLLENGRLRALLALRPRLTVPEQAAEVLYDAPDPYTRRVIIDRGMLQDVAVGSPVIDEAGVLGQVTRVHPFLAEVTLLVERDYAIPVLNTRTGARSVAYGNPASDLDGGLELRFMPSAADVQGGDVLTTSGVDGVYPAGLPVAKVDRVERRADSAFARIHCIPMARMEGARHVMVLQPLSEQLPPRPAATPATPQGAAVAGAPRGKPAAGAARPVAAGAAPAPAAGTPAAAVAGTGAARSAAAASTAGSRLATPPDTAPASAAAARKPALVAPAASAPAPAAARAPSATPRAAPATRAAAQL